MITYKIHLIRTGTTQVGDRRVYTGKRDVSLSKTGIEHLEMMKSTFLYPLASVVYSSPLARCVQTAEILYPETQLIPVEELGDLDLGEFEGKGYNELKQDPDFVRWIGNSKENTPPGGEDTISFTRRIVVGIDRIFGEMMSQKLTNVAVVTHGGVIMTLLSNVGVPEMPMKHWSVDNGVGYTIIMNPQMWMREGKCEVFAHLPYLRE